MLYLHFREARVTSKGDMKKTKIAFLLKEARSRIEEGAGVRPGVVVVCDRWPCWYIATSVCRLPMGLNREWRFRRA